MSPSGSVLSRVFQSNANNHVDVAIIGGGLAGLNCAYHLEQLGQDWHLFEASTVLGGRVQTQQHPEGFLLDAGFQVLNTAYEELNPFLPHLELNPFYAGAMIRTPKGIHKLGDPRRDWTQLWQGLWTPVATFSDKLKVLQLQGLLMQLSEADMFQLEDHTTEQFLKQFGFSEGFIQQFFVPFFGGVFLEASLATSVRKFLWSFATFVYGQACLPTGGMQALPQAMASLLPTERLHTQQGVLHVEPPVPRGDAGKASVRRLLLSTGEVVFAKRVVVALDMPSLCQLLGLALPVMYHHTQVLYFSREGPLPRRLKQRALWLNGLLGDENPIQHFCFLSEISGSYAPPNHTLLSVTVKPSWTPYDVQEATLVALVKEQLRQWLGKIDGKQGPEWRYLQRSIVPTALPKATSLYGSTEEGFPPLNEWVEQLESLWSIHGCGDYTDTASINGALRSGRLLAHRLVAE
jgi:phytoene dehydrogenase-like protein